ncbi:replication initiation protein [Halonatronum saccharophilum]|uniref:replication initiation protein n=1 Tax=Halonatronum saccharophilum TaxID=150060 RepID=UPI0004B8A772|nr:replication initiation protein [Halonatronum saccharophilum]
MENNENTLIVKHNRLIEAKYKLSLQEQKLILILASRINKDDKNFNRHIFSVKELAEILGINKDWFYSEIKSITKSLINRVIEIKKDNKFLQVGFLEYAEYLENEGIVELQFSSKLKPYFLQLKNNFTKYYLKNIIQFESIYSIRIYELLKQYERIKKRRFEINELKNILGIEDKYERYYDLKRRVLFQAKDEINQKTDLKIDFKEIKTGRKVTAIEFVIKRKEVAQKELEFKESPKEKEYSVEVLKLFKVLPLEEQIEPHKRELKTLLDKHSFEYLKEDIEYANEVKPDNFFGFLKASCDSGHYAAAQMEKREKEKELARKKAEEEKLKKQIKDNIGKKSKKKAVKMYNDLSKEELDKYNDEYDRMARFVPENIRPSREEYIVGSLQDDIREELEDLLFN